MVKRKQIKRKSPVIAMLQGTTTPSKKIKGKIRFFRNYNEVIIAMEKGDIDYVITDYPIALHLQRSVMREFQIQKILTQVEEYAVGVNQQSKLLLGAINKALRDLAFSGRLAFLQRQWL